MTFFSGHGGTLPSAYASEVGENTDHDQANDAFGNHPALSTGISVGFPPYLNCRSASSLLTQTPFTRRCRPRLWVENPSSGSVSTGTKRVRGHYDSDDEVEDSSDDEDLLIGHPPRPTKQHKRNHHSHSTSSSGISFRISKVKFSRPLVTAVHIRPRTANKDKSALFYCQADQARFRREYREYVRKQKLEQDKMTTGVASSSGEEKKPDEELNSKTAVVPVTSATDGADRSTHEGSSEVTDSSGSSNEDESDESSCSSPSSQSDEE